MMELEKSRTLKRRLRRERIAMEKAGDFISFTPSSVPVVAKSDDQPKLTNSAKRAARKRKKAATWQKEIEDICSSTSITPADMLQENKDAQFKKPKSKKSKNKKRVKLSEDKEPLISSDKDASSSVRTDTTEESVGSVDSNIVDWSAENNDEANGEKVKPDGLSKEPKKDLPPKKRRFVLFVGNLSYETKEADVMEHFKKVGSISSVRIAKHKDSNNCRGFCHLEVGDEDAYLKALSLHHTFMAKRRINVEYSSGQSEEKGEVKRKNFKLQTLNKTGRLGGSKFHQNLNGNTKVKSKPETVRGAFFV